MTQTTAPEPRVEAKLLGILLSGIFVQTRPECSDERRASLELPPSGAYRIDVARVENTLASSLPAPEREPEPR